MGFRSKAEKFSALVSKEGGNERGNGFVILAFRIAVGAVRMKRLGGS